MQAAQPAARRRRQDPSGRMSGPHYLRGEPAGWSTEIYVTLLGEIDVYSVKAVDVGRSDWIWAIW